MATIPWYTLSNSSMPRYCSRCGLLLTNQWFELGHGRYLCALCESLARSNQLSDTLLQSPSFPPVSETHKEAMDEIIRLNGELAKANQRIAELESKLKAARDTLDDEPDERET